MGQKERKVVSVWTVTWGSSLKCEYLADARLQHSTCIFTCVFALVFILQTKNTICTCCLHLYVYSYLNSSLKCEYFADAGLSYMYLCYIFFCTARLQFPYSILCAPQCHTRSVCDKKSWANMMRRNCKNSLQCVLCLA